MKPKDKYRMKKKIAAGIALLFGGGNGVEFGCAVSGLWHLLSGETEKGMYDSQKRHKIVTKNVRIFSRNCSCNLQ